MDFISADDVPTDADCAGATAGALRRYRERSQRLGAVAVDDQQSQRLDATTRLRRLGIVNRTVSKAILNRSAIYIGPRTLYGMSAPSHGRAAM